MDLQHEIYGNMKQASLLMMTAMLAWQCGQAPKKDIDMQQNKEPQGNTLAKPGIVEDSHSFSKPDEARVVHIDLDLKVDFEAKTLAGAAQLHLAKNSAEQLFLDTRLLDIKRVEANGKAVPFQLHDEIPFLGSALEIDLEPGTEQVTVYYKTHPEAPALQWLAPAQTHGKKQPFLFTQSQAILARTGVPCQDSPGVRFTYSANIHVGAGTGLMALMSAGNPQEISPDGVYHFKMDKPIPSYLLALAVGELAFVPLGERTGVYAEPAMLKKAVFEMAEMDNMLEAAEKIYGPYQWGRFDVLVLPPSFPFGGMENPKLTFATPTILAGDRTLMSLIAHELAHSWSGNLVTNATWNDFWLNEGFTVYFELRIMEELYGKSFSDMLALIGYQDLLATIEQLNYSADTRLKLDLSGRDPDEGVTSIAYEKGFLFLKCIEERVGRKWWDVFVHEYFTAHQFQSVTTEEFLVFLRKNLLDKFKGAEEDINIKKWVYTEGLPDNCPVIESGRFATAEAAAQGFLEGKGVPLSITENWVYQEWVHFLRQMPPALSVQQMAALDQAFGFTRSGNSEILFEWLMLAAKNSFRPAYARAELFLLEVGRRKFTVPLYRELLNNPRTRALARQIYQKARPNYHYFTSAAVDKMMAETSD